MSNSKRIGVIGVGSFGTSIANLLSYNTKVLVYTRKESVLEAINNGQAHMGLTLTDKVEATNDLKYLAEQCDVIFPVVPSDNFRSMMKNLSPYLRPYHVLIHGTKGFDVQTPKDMPDEPLTRAHIYTMSEVIRKESVVVRIGCLAGPNLSKEIIEVQPTATVIASRFNEVIEVGKQVLNSKHFQVFGTRELLGTELAGALKNSIAIGSGILTGKGMGKNIQGLLINRGMMEMINFGKAMGTSPKAFLGTAGIADLIATATSEKSRNFTFGKRLGEGEDLENIKSSMPELAEGVRTLKIAKGLATHYGLNAPITDMIYRVVYEGFAIDTAIELLMRYPYYVDVDFI